MLKEKSVLVLLKFIGWIISRTMKMIEKKLNYVWLCDESGCGFIAQANTEWGLEESRIKHIHKSH